MTLEEALKEIERLNLIIADQEKEIEKLNKELLKVQAGVARGEAMFNNPAFVEKAPQFKIDAERKI